MCIRWFCFKGACSSVYFFVVCVQGATRRVWDVWGAVLLGVRNVLAATDTKEQNASVRIHANAVLLKVHHHLNGWFCFLTQI